MKKINFSIALFALLIAPLQSSGLIAPELIAEEIDTSIQIQEPVQDPGIVATSAYAHQRHEPTSTATPARYLQERTLRWPTLRLIEDSFVATKVSTTNVIPTVGMVITDNTTLEPGTYSNNVPGSTFITIAADNVTLDCNGAILEDVTPNHLTDGIKIASGLNNVTVTNCTLKNMFLGIISGSSDPDGPISTGLTITQNTFLQYATDVELYYLNYWSHLMIRNTNNSEISYNRSEPFDVKRHWANGIFMSLWESDHNDVHHNTSVSMTGIHVTLNSDSNNIHDNEFGFSYWQNGGIEIDRASDSNNIHHNQASYYNYEPTSPTLAGSGIMLHGFTASDAPRYQEAAHHNIITDNTTVSNYKMISAISLVHDAHDNLITRNTVNGAYVGIEAYFGQTDAGGSPTYYFPHHNTIDGNSTVQYDPNTNTEGVWLGNGTHHFTITNNTYTGGYHGVRAMYLVGSTEAPQVPITDMVIQDNRMLNMVSFGLFNPNEDVIERWNIYHNYFSHNGSDPNLIDGALELQSSSSEIFAYENTFIDNGLNGEGNYDQLWSSPQTQLQREGRGNYYSDYDEPGEGCNDTDLNGICDLPRNFSTGAVDANPLVNPTFCANNNCPPVFRPIAPLTVNEQDMAIIWVNAYDYEHDPLTITVSDKRFQSYDGCWPGRNAWVWWTNIDSSGTYPVTVTVSDGVNQVQQSTVVTVRDTCFKDKWGRMRCLNYAQRVSCY
ncbi:MAG: hypothetical protein HZC01_01710 [Candidatus Kerfeldbacteria bacterium]|nr:hypothetical protein [Candidatus Kerfeldbacteria bacterium]